MLQEEGRAIQRPSLLDRLTVGRDLKSERSPGGCKEGFGDVNESGEGAATSPPRVFEAKCGV